MSKIAIEIGGTRIRAALLNERFDVLERHEINNNPALDPEQILASVITMVGMWKNDYSGITGMGIVAPGPLDIKKGMILFPPNLPKWHGFKVAQYMADELGLPTAFNNDANAAGLAEALLGRGRDYDSVSYITISTGLGSAFIYRGEIIEGANSAAGDIYNMFINEDPYSHQGANSGGAEGQCSGVGIARIASEIFAQDISAREVFDRAQTDDNVAKQVLEVAATNTAKAIANISCVVDPDIFVLGGSVVLKNPWYLDLIREKTREFVSFPDRLRLERAVTGDDAALIGATLLL